MPDQISASQRALTDAEELASLPAPAQAGADLPRGVPRQDDSLEPDPVPAEPWTDEDLEKFYAEYVEMFDEQDALEGTDLPICDEGGCPVDTCPFGPDAAGLSEEELLDAMASCELSPFRVERQRGIPGLASALGQAGWSVHRICVGQDDAGEQMGSADGLSKQERRGGGVDMRSELSAERAAVVLDRLVEAIEGRIDETRAICVQYEGRVDVFKTFGKAAYDACNDTCSRVELLTLEEILEMIEDLSFELATQGDDCPQA